MMLLKSSPYEEEESVNRMVAQQHNSKCIILIEKVQVKESSVKYLRSF